MAGIAKLGLLLGGLAGVRWVVRYFRSVHRGDYRHADGLRSLTWIPGGGSHGSSGGQVPPIVADDPDWDIDRRIR